MADDVYTRSLLGQTPEQQLNSILWRLAVAVGLAKHGDGYADLDYDKIIAIAEERLSIYDDSRD